MSILNEILSLLLNIKESKYIVNDEFTIIIY